MVMVVVANGFWLVVSKSLKIRGKLGIPKREVYEKMGQSGDFEEGERERGLHERENKEYIRKEEKWGLS